MRNLARMIGVIMCVVTVIAGMAWVNNIVVSKQWMQDNVFVEAQQKVESGLDQDSDIEVVEKSEIQPGWFTFLDWACVDHSTVTTFIVFFGSLMICLGFLVIGFTRSKVMVSDYFPYFKSYTEVTIALGLMGTIWGLILIGYQGSSVNMTDIVECLRTALYSTLMAFVWVYLVVFPVRYVMQRMYIAAVDPDDSEDKEVMEYVDDLGESAKTTSRTVNSMNGSAKKLNTTLNITDKNIVKINEGLGELSEKAGMDLFSMILKSFKEAGKVVGEAHEVLVELKAEAASSRELLVEMSDESKLRLEVLVGMQEAVSGMALESAQRGVELEKQSQKMDELAGTISSESAARKGLLDATAAESVARKDSLENTDVQIKKLVAVILEQVSHRFTSVEEELKASRKFRRFIADYFKKHGVNTRPGFFGWIRNMFS